MSVSRCIVLVALIAACERGNAENAPTPVPKLVVTRAERPPSIDGVLSDPAWRSAHSTGPFVDTRGEGRAPFYASAKMLWDERYLYVAVEVKDDLLMASDTQHDAHLWKQDCVELMIAPGRSGASYFEIEVSPRGVVFDTRFDSRRAPAPFGYVSWDSRIEVASKPRGQIDDDQPDGGYDLEMALPWQAFSAGGGNAPRPVIGDEWRANLYVLDRTLNGQQGAAWSPPGIADFHVPRRFGSLALGGSERLESVGGPH
jgi:hypothetical protein